MDLSYRKRSSKVDLNGVHFSDNGVDRSRVGAGTSITMHDMGLSTIIGQQNKDATGKPLDSSMKKSIERLRTWDSRSQAHSSAERKPSPSTKRNG